jgi:hypothetical protein
MAWSMPSAMSACGYTQNNAQIQAAAMALGEVTYLTDEEALCYLPPAAFEVQQALQARVS